MPPLLLPALVLALSLLGCAASRPATPAAATPAPREIPKPASAYTPESELAQAFEGDEATPEAAAAAPPVSPTPGPSGPVSPPSPGLVETARAQQAAHEQELRESLQARDTQRAARAATAWLLACGPETIERCRTQALQGLQRAAGLEKTRLLQDRLKALRAADTCLRQAEGRVKQPPPCLDATAATYQREKDALMLARVHAARAAIAARDKATEASAPGLWSRAEKACSQPRCVAVRRKALRSLAQHHLRRNEPEAAARAALAEMRLFATTLPDEQRRYAWTDEVEKTCAALDKKAGPGSCRKLERSTNRELSFRDYSAQQEGEGLPLDKVRQVNEHFGVLFEECLTEQARRMLPPAAETYAVRWMVTPEGRVTQVRLAKPASDEGPLAQCFRAKLDLWRYPRYRGEAQHVEQSFTVTASSGR